MPPALAKMFTTQMLILNLFTLANLVNADKTQNCYPKLRINIWFLHRTSDHKWFLTASCLFVLKTAKMMLSEQLLIHRAAIQQQYHDFWGGLVLYCTGLLCPGNVCHSIGTINPDRNQTWDLNQAGNHPGIADTMTYPFCRWGNCKCKLLIR